MPSQPCAVPGRPDPPFVVAHRSGNDLTTLRAAESLGVALVEADVHLFRGRLEVRHLKTVGPLPLLWDRWRLASPFARRLRFEELLAASAPSTALLVDLKGRDRRLAVGVRDALRAAGRGATVCARAWHLLEPLAAAPGLRLVHSVGNRRQLRSLLRRSVPLHGVSIHERLLDARVVAELRARAELVVTWPVNSLERALELGHWGVQGVITDRPELLRQLHPADATA